MRDRVGRVVLASIGAVGVLTGVLSLVGVLHTGRAVIDTIVTVVSGALVIEIALHDRKPGA